MPTISTPVCSYWASVNYDEWTEVTKWPWHGVQVQGFYRVEKLDIDYGSSHYKVAISRDIFALFNTSTDFTGKET